MNSSKLTLSIPDNVIEKAKKFASKNHISVSKLFVQFIDKIAVDEPELADDEFLDKLRQLPVSPAVKRLAGILKDSVPNNVNLKDLKYEYLKEKYGL